MEKSYVLVDDFDKFKSLVNHIKENDIISFDIETNSLNPRKGKIIGFSVSAKIGVGYYMPTMVYNGELVDFFIEDKNCHILAKKVITLLLSKKIIGHNLSFDFINSLLTKPAFYVKISWITIYWKHNIDNYH